MARWTVRGLVALSALVAASPLLAQTSRTTAYPASHFARSAPRNALDIARLVPGFALDLGNVASRGFAGAAGNVVINGARPSTKSESLETLLARIPASRVVRVEVGPGDLYGADYAGKSQVLDVILSAASGIDGTATASARRIYTGEVKPNASVSAVITRGASSISLSAGLGRDDYVEEGFDRLTDPADGSPIEFRRKVNRIFQHSPYVSAGWGLERASDRSIHLNARYAAEKFDLVQTNHVTPVGDVERDDRLVQDFADPVIELSGDITRPLAGGAVKLLGLATRRKRDNRETYKSRIAGDTVGGFIQNQTARLNETLARLVWTRADLGGFNIEAGGEAVLNTLDARLDLFEFEADGSRTRIDLPLDNATVREKRAELFVNLGRQLGGSLRVDGGLTVEMSRLKVRGDTRADRSLRFWKPNLTLDWKPGGGWHAQLSVRRTVAQLDFYDFVDVAELANDRVNAGNANLMPQQAWEFRATVEKPVLGDGLAKLDLGIDRIAMFQDRILTDEGFDAPGNIGSGRRRFVAGTIDAPLARLGIPGAKLKLTGQWQTTRVRDPISHRFRRFTGEFPEWTWKAEYRHDVGAISYGFTLEDSDRITFFRTDEIDSNWNGGILGTAFVEYRPSARTTVTFDVDNLFDVPGRRHRLLFDPNRTAPAPAIDEVRERNRHISFGLTVKQSFGTGGRSAQ